MNTQEFASTIRKKYPGSYDGVDDVTLSKKVLEKYPEYADRVTFESQPDEQNVLQNAVSDLKGLGESVKRIATSPLDIPMSVGRTGVELAQGKPFMETPVGQQASELAGLPKAIFNRAKDVVTDPVGSFQKNPIYTTMDVASIAVPAAGAAKGLFAKAAPTIAKGAESFAQNQAAKSLGFTKRFLKTSDMAGKAKQSAQTLMDEGVITPFASADDISARITDLSKASGERIGQFLKSVDETGGVMNPKAAIKELETLRPKFKGGAYDAIHGRINRAIDTIRAHGNKPIPFAEANELKGVLQDLADWKSNKDASLLDKQIAGKFRNSLDTSLEQASNKIGQGPGFEQFKKDKRIFGATQQAEDPIFNRISSEQGNNAIGLDELVLAAPQLAVGGGATAAVTGGIFRALKRFGPQTAAVTANKIAKILKSQPQRSGEIGSLLKEAVSEGPGAIAAANALMEIGNASEMTKPKPIFRKNQARPLFRKAS